MDNDSIWLLSVKEVEEAGRNVPALERIGSMRTDQFSGPVKTNERDPRRQNTFKTLILDLWSPEL